MKLFLRFRHSFSRLGTLRKVRLCTRLIGNVPTVGFLAAACICACSGSGVTADDFDRAAYVPTEASGFEILAAEGCRSTLLRVFNPWQGAEGFEQRVFLSRDGEPAPRGFDGQMVRVPARRIICMSSSHVAMLEAIGEDRRIVGVSGIDYISNRHVNEHRRCGEVRDVGYDSNLDFELVAAMKPDVVLIYGIRGENTQLTAKFDELGIPYIYIGEYLEESPLGKAEWMRVAAEIEDCGDRADSLLRGIRERYEATADEIREYAAGKCEDTACLPRVLLNTPYRDTWFMPSAKSYMVRLIRDAGGDTYTPGGESTASMPVDMERAYLLAADADVWLNTGSCTTMAELTAQNPKFADMPVVRSGRVYNNNARSTPAGGSDFWESGVVRPDVVLRDLAKILHPELYPDEELYYYRRLK